MQKLGFKALQLSPMLMSLLGAAKNAVNKYSNTSEKHRDVWEMSNGEWSS